MEDYIIEKASDIIGKCKYLGFDTLIMTKDDFPKSRKGYINMTKFIKGLKNHLERNQTQQKNGVVVILLLQRKYRMR